MPTSHRRGVLPRRRRRDEEGEDESSIAGDLEDFSMSEGSAISNAEEEVDIEGSEVSLEDNETRVSNLGNKTSSAGASGQAAIVPESKSNVAIPSISRVEESASANGVQSSQAINLDRTQSNEGDGSSVHVSQRATSSAPQLEQLQETPAERARREHQEYVRQRNSNPAFVPNRGGFFLHDDRSAVPSSPFGRPFPRGRGRGYNGGYGVGRGYGQQPPGPSDRPWAHDLHDAVNKASGTPPPKHAPASFQIPTAKPAAVAPNRTFSVSTVLGNVTLQVMLPGMETQKKSLNLVKRQHTLLPQHRPPLRRDKPVRISIPDEEPRYIFPSTERSFIFIPRAMRPNQQVYTRGRGRGSYQGSRRPSMMGSTYTPSVAMSRKSSVGGVASNGMSTPIEGNIPRGPMLQNFNRPVVRMPIAPLPMAGVAHLPSMSQTTMPLVPVPVPPIPPEMSGQIPPILHSPTVTLPMHQPRPQKTVSVAEIESPAVKGPQQQQEQPFHQQMPPGVSLGDGPTSQQIQPPTSMTMTTPLSHIPEGAIYAQPFQPYPMYQQGGYYDPAYSGAPSMYHNPAYAYGMSMGGPVLAPHFAPSQPFVPTSQAAETGIPHGAMVQDANGMVYYYDPSQFSADGSHMTQYPIAGGGGGMVGMSAHGPYFYPGVPGGMYYPTAQ